MIYLPANLSSPELIGAEFCSLRADLSRIADDVAGADATTGEEKMLLLANLRRSLDFVNLRLDLAEVAQDLELKTRELNRLLEKNEQLKREKM